MTRLHDLEKRWLAHPLGKSRGLGGRRSLHGFRYQLALSLDSFLDAIDTGDPGGTTAFESLSDLAQLDGELIYLIQVKATLDRPRLREVAAEALALDEFLKEEYPEWRSRMRFRVWCRRRKTPAEFSSLSLDELELTGAAAKRWATLKDRLEPVEVRPDPYISLVIRIFQQVPDPFLLVDSWIGLLVRLLGEERSSEEVVEALLSTWQTQRGRLEVTPPGRLLDLTDVTSLEGGTDILVGERPQPENLVRGCFMARPGHLGKVLHAVESCLAEAASPEPADRMVPVVWIRGTSGCGKSVLMLQALAELTGRSGVVTHLLAPMSRQLPEALTYWRETTEQVVIGIDDMYSPAVRDGALWSRVHTAVFESSWSVPPIVLTCGPDEYFRAFEREALSGGGLRCADISIPVLDPDELAAYHDWFCDHTGVDVRTVRESNFAIAAFLLELYRRGEDRDLGQFAARLDQRLELLGVREAILAVLAGMDLGFPVPAAVFAGQESGRSKLDTVKSVRPPMSLG